MAGPRHYRVSTREHWDRLTGEVHRWAQTWGETAALWRHTGNCSVRFVAGSKAQVPERLWVVIYSVAAGAQPVPGLAGEVWSAYDGMRYRYEQYLARRDPDEKPPDEDEPTDVKIIHPHDPFATPAGRKRRSDAGVSKGPRHLRRPGAGGAAGGDRGKD